MTLRRARRRLVVQAACAFARGRRFVGVVPLVVGSTANPAAPVVSTLVALLASPRMCVFAVPLARAATGPIPLARREHSWEAECVAGLTWWRHECLTHCARSRRRLRGHEGRPGCLRVVDRQARPRSVCSYRRSPTLCPAWRVATGSFIDAVRLVAQQRRFERSLHRADPTRLCLTGPLLSELVAEDYDACFGMRGVEVERHEDAEGEGRREGDGGDGDGLEGAVAEPRQAERGIGAGAAQVARGELKADFNGRGHPPRHEREEDLAEDGARESEADGPQELRDVPVSLRQARNTWKRTHREVRDDEVDEAPDARRGRREEPGVLCVWTVS